MKTNHFSKRSWLSQAAGTIGYFFAKLTGGAKGTRILCYHKVNDDEKGYMCVPTETFRNHMKWLSENGYRSAGLFDLLEGKTDEKSVVITFDDGYEDNYLNAFPIMREYGFAGTIFLIARKIGEQSYLKISQIQEMHKADFEFGSHTLSHPNLKPLSADEKRREISDSKIVIEKLLGMQCDFFCYPFGHFDKESIEIVKDCGYRGACSNTPGDNRRINNRFLLERTEMAPHDTADDLKKKMAGAYDMLHKILHAVRGRP
jgi:peptidoglycan/xylan/chitin deacetylase (PgdA/CDA1 family)